MLSELFWMTFGRVFFTLASSPASTALAIFSAFILCLVFQLTVLRPANKSADKPLGAMHFVWAATFILYLTVVYRLTTIGTVWDAMRNGIVITIGSTDISTVHLIPFASFAGGFYGILFFMLNIAMTVPLGIFLAALWPTMRSWKRIALAGFCFSLAIELSQLFNNRGTNIDDLIANTLGAVLGYVLFMAVVRLRKRWVSKREQTYRQEQLQTRKQERLQARQEAVSRSKVLRNEGVLYMALSFLGMFILFNPSFVSDIDARFASDQQGVLAGEISSNRQTFATDDDWEYDDWDEKGTVIEVRPEGLLIELVEVEDMGTYGFIAANADDTLFVPFSDGITVDIWRTDGQSAFPVAIGAGTQDIRAGDMVDIWFSDESLDLDSPDSNSPATRIIVWRFS